MTKSRPSRGSRHHQSRTTGSRRRSGASRINASASPDDDDTRSDPDPAGHEDSEDETVSYDEDRTKSSDASQEEGRSKLYDDETLKYREAASLRFDELTTDDAQGHEEATTSFGEEVRPASGHPQHDRSRRVPITGPTDGHLDYPSDDDSEDDLFGHPLENPYFRSRRPPATTPGAVAVVRRGYEESDLNNDDEWDPTTPFDLDVEEEPCRNDSPTRTYLDAPVTLKKKMNEMSTRRMLLYVLLTVLILGGAGAGIAIAISGNKDASPAPASSSASDPCDFTGTVQPNPILQCACYGNITVLSDEILSSYLELKETFIPDVFPDEFDYLSDSCEPRNAALLWLAADQLHGRPTESTLNRYLLSLLYTYWKGTKWKNNQGWLSSQSECEWWGVRCTDSRVASIGLSENNVRGDLVTELGLFRDLRTLNVAINDLGGSLPSEIAGASSLEVLVLSRNQVVGSIPTTIGELTNLKRLSLASNLITGLLPTDGIVKLSDLEYLELTDNAITGNLDSRIGELTSLKLFSAATNALRGPLPPTIGLLTNLENFWIAENDLSGTIPSEVFTVTTLKTLLLGFNSLDRSPLPTQIGQLTNLEELILSNMQLTGTIPSEIGELTKLDSLLLFSNTLTGTIPSTLGRLVEATKIVTYYNSLSGTVPEEVCALTENVLKELVVSCGLSLGPKCDCCLDCFDV